MPTAFLVTCIGGACAGQTEIKYNILGPLLPRYSEHGFEVEYSRSTMLIPFVRLAYLNRDYTDKSWEGEVVGDNTENGMQVWIGNKMKPFPWRFTRNLELLLFYRQSRTDFTHTSSGWATGEGRDKVDSKSIGTGLSFNINLGKWIVAEPFWYGDYGRYEIERVYGNTAPYSPYFHKWDDEHRVGLNIGLKI